MARGSGTRIGLLWLIAWLCVSHTASAQDHLRELLEPLLGERAPRSPSLSQVARRLVDGDVGPACQAVVEWPDREALVVRQVLLAAEHLHGELLVQSFRPEEAGQVAASILEAQVAARATRLGPWRDPEPGRTDRQEDVHWFQPDGVFVRLRAPAPGLSLEEVLRQLEDAAVWRAPCIAWPGAMDDAAKVTGTFPPVPLRWFLEKQWEQRGLCAVRLFLATWILPLEGFEAWLEELPVETTERDAWRVLAFQERTLVRRALQELRERPVGVRAAEGALLLRSLGLDLGAPTGTVHDDSDRSVLELVRATSQPGTRVAPRWLAPSGQEVLEPLRRRALLLAGVSESGDPATDAWLAQRRAGSPSRPPAGETLARILEGVAPYDLLAHLPATLEPSRSLREPAAQTPRALLHQAAWRARQQQEMSAAGTAAESAVHRWVQAATPISLDILVSLMCQPGPWRDPLLPILALEGDQAQVGALLDGATEQSVRESWSLSAITTFQEAMVAVVAARLLRDPYLASTLAGRLRPIEKQQPAWGRLREQLRALARTLPPEQNWLMELRGLPPY